MNPFFLSACITACFSCGLRSEVKCEDCGKLSGKSHTYYCQRCSDLFHRNPTFHNRVGHNITDAVDVDGLVGELDLLSVICIETSHYVCFTRDPRDDTERKWIFFDSMAERVCESIASIMLFQCVLLPVLMAIYDIPMQMTHTTLPK